LDLEHGQREKAMRISKLLAALSITASTQAFAYDAFEADFATCTQGNDRGASWRPARG